MGWEYFSDEEKELTNRVLDTPLIYPLLGDKKIEGQCSKIIVFQGVEKLVECSAEKNITIKAPNFVSYDGKFLRSAGDNKKFLDVKEGNTNG